MCGVIGVYLTDVVPDDLELVRNVFLQSMIRGKHATGLTYLKNGEMSTLKEGIPADKFLEHIDFQKFLNLGMLRMIGHIRYSTSDLRYNQPFQGTDIAIAHNGVISQDPDIWEYKTETGNDSELILRCIEAGGTPLEVYKERSMATVTLEDSLLTGFRNHERPLWYAEIGNGVIFASTKDILLRAGVTVEIKRCEPLVRYTFNHDEGLKIDRTYYDEKLGDLQPC